MPPLVQEVQTPKIYTVRELTGEIKDLLENRFEFVWVEGEISNFSAPSSGHYYMVLKDGKAQIRAVMFRVQARRLRFMPENGMHVLVQGRVGVYPPRGEYQIILDYLEPMGVGALALAFERLKKKLASQGIFDEDIKKPLPFLPQRVAVVTSPTGAAIRDFLKIIRRRFANIEVTIVPVRVQGDEAAGEIVEALERINREMDVDVIVLTRGGGSLEDLWAFNQEELALAIRKSDIPVLSAVGHEIDLTIADLAADVRAPTPSAAAEILVAEKQILVEQLNDLKTRLLKAFKHRVEREFRDLNHLKSRLKDPGKQLGENWMRLDDSRSRLIRLIQRMVEDRRKRLDAEYHALLASSPEKRADAARQQLDFQRTSLMRAVSAWLREKHTALSTLEKRMMDLNPMSILERGYSITLKLPEKQVLKDISRVEKGNPVRILLARGALRCRVEELEDPDFSL